MSAVYPTFRETVGAWILGDIALPTITGVYAIAVDDTYVYDATDSSLTDIAGASIVAPEVALTGVTYVNGVLDAVDPAWTGLDTEDVADAFILYLKDDGGNSYLLCHLDSSSDGSIPANIDSENGRLVFNDNGICVL